MGILGILRQIKHRALVVKKRASLEGRTRARLRRQRVKIADESVYVHHDSVVHRDVTIGAGTRMNRDVLIEDGVVIGTQVSIGRGVYLCTRSHELSGPQRRAGAAFHAAVTVGDGVWIGAHAVVLPGVTIAHGCVIAAGAVVTKNTAADGLYAGVPARRIRDLG